MRLFLGIAVFSLVLALGLAWPAMAPAAAVGRVTQMEGRVDLLKGGKLPTIQAKVNDELEVGDVLRTKSLSKAQITFVDESVVTISPESRLAIEEYLFDSSKNQRNAVLQLLQGLAHIAVSKIIKTTDPNFLIKTQTAIMGVRGSELGIRNHPNSTTSLQFEGHSQVRNIFPEIPGQVDLRNMQGTEVFRGLPPTMPFDIVKEDQQQFMRMINIPPMSVRGGTGPGAAGATAPTCGSGGTRCGTATAFAADATGTRGTTAAATSSTDATSTSGAATSTTSSTDATSTSGTATASSFSATSTGTTGAATSASPVVDSLATTVSATSVALSTVTSATAGPGAATSQSPATGTTQVVSQIVVIPPNPTTQTTSDTSSTSTTSPHKKIRRR